MNGMKSHMNHLALDSANDVFSAALECSGNVFYVEVDAAGRHAELIMEMVDWLCKTAGIDPAALDAVSCMKGPGSFTGLRIAYAAAKGLAVALGIPLIAVPTLDCLAAHLSHWPGLVLPVMDAKQGRFFAALYRGGERLTDYLDAAAEAIAEEAAPFQEKFILTGSGAALFQTRLAAGAAHLAPDSALHGAVIDPDARRGRAKELLRLAHCVILKGEDDRNSGPMYIRKSDAELKRGNTAGLER